MKDNFTTGYHTVTCQKLLSILNPDETSAKCLCHGHRAHGDCFSLALQTKDTKARTASSLVSASVEERQCSPALPPASRAIWADPFCLLSLTALPSKARAALIFLCMLPSEGLNCFFIVTQTLLPNSMSCWLPMAWNHLFFNLFQSSLKIIIFDKELEEQEG